ncbi:MNIO family bufferin maturase [Pararhizobium haloflavum]|uniref:MNIO family bufferin maturase n=1 Tax=Pararhizobium haloflavum TaxID=2037914 RepID=UPI000C179FEF|nr:DUF692 domain-containing protein [Pararhizobium haloflavum]
MIPAALPLGVGVGFKARHFADIIGTRPNLAFVEVHAENFLGEGGPPHAQLSRLSEDLALSIHGVGLNIGAPAPLDRSHLQRIKRLCDRYQPASFSEHLAWSSHGENHFADLLPLPYTAETLDWVSAHIDEVQDLLGRQMLLENPSTYLSFNDSTMTETDFLGAVVECTGCGLLLDLNNVFVSAVNHGTAAREYLSAIPLRAVGEVHLGGHHADRLSDGATLLIDSHSAAVADPVWDLFETIIAQCGALPTLIEWDNDVPEWPILFGEAQRAANVMDRAGRHAETSNKVGETHAVLC